MRYQCKSILQEVVYHLMRKERNKEVERTLLLRVNLQLLRASLTLLYTGLTPCTLSPRLGLYLQFSVPLTLEGCRPPFILYLTRLHGLRFMCKELISKGAS